MLSSILQFDVRRPLSLAAPLALALLVSSGWAAGPPSLEEITATLEKQRQQIKSLYVELKHYSTISVEPKVLVSWPRFSGTLFIFEETHHFAFKGGKRYARQLQPPEAKLLQPIGRPRVDPRASPEDQEIQRQQVEDWKRRERETAKMERMGMKPAERKESDVIRLTPDEARGDDGTVAWERRVDPRPRSPQVFISRRDPNRQWVQIPTMYFSSIGWDCDTEANTRDESALENARRTMVKSLKRGDFSLVGGTTELDGARCVVLERELKAAGSLRKIMRKRAEKVWLDLDHGLAVRQRESRFEDGDLTRTINSDFIEILPGIWFPKKTEVQNFAPPDAPKEYQGRPVLVWHSDLVKWIVNDVPEDLFNPVIKPGDRVFDSRLYPDAHP